MDALTPDETVWFQIAAPDSSDVLEAIDDRLVEATEACSRLLRQAIESVAVGLKPDLVALGASKATVKLGAKHAVKNGKLTAFVTEVGVEGTVEVSIEFSR